MHISRSALLIGVASFSQFLATGQIVSSSPQSLPQSMLTDFGYAGGGGDDTAVIQAALNSTSVQNRTLRIPAGTYNVGPLYLPANSSLLLDAGVVVQATSGYGETDHLLNIDGVQNVTITGTPGQSIFRMRKTEYANGEYRHCLAITGSVNVTVSGIQCNDSGGDGLYIGEGSLGYSSNVQISNSGFNNNKRQGMSLISGIGVSVTNCTFTNTSGAAPSSGIDIEPNGPGDFLQNILISGGSATNNAGNGLTIGIERLHAYSPAVSITISNFSTQQNGLSGYYATNEQDSSNYSVPGTILILNSRSTQDTQYGALASYWEAGGTSLTFENLSVTDANQWHNNVDNSAIAVKRGGGAAHPMGNVHFFGTVVTSSGGNLDNYFTAYDWSNVGFSQLQFLSSGLLTGARFGQVLLSGQSVGAINVP